MPKIIKLHLLLTLIIILLTSLLFAKPSYAREVRTANIQDFYVIGNSNNYLLLFFDFECEECLNTFNLRNFAAYNAFYNFNVERGEIAVVPIPVDVVSTQNSTEKALISNCILGIDGGYYYANFFVYLFNNPQALESKDFINSEFIQDFYEQRGGYNQQEALFKAQLVKECSGIGVFAKERLQKNNELFNEFNLTLEDLPAAYIGSKKSNTKNIVEVYRIELNYNAINNELLNILATSKPEDINKDGQFSVLDIVELIKQLFK